MKRMKPWLPVLPAMLLLGIRASAQAAQTEFAEIPVSSLQISCALAQTGTAAELDWWYSDREDCRYLFLPAAADRDALTITYTLTVGETLTLNGQSVISGAETALLGTDDIFTVCVDGTDCGTLHVLQSNLGSIWLSLEEGGLARIDSDKEAVTSGTALMLDAEGAVQYSGALETLKGRGNSSWYYAEKKPYNLRLPKQADLYGMGRARKWALLSNQLDQSMLRNELAFAMSRASGLRYTTDSVFVDLYIDGGYRGTYQLTERVLVDPERVSIRDLKKATEACNSLPLKDYRRIVAGGTLNGEEPGSYQYYEIPNDPEDITGGYLFQFQRPNHAERGEFITTRGQICDITAPKYASKAQTEYLRNFVQELEDAIYAESGCNSLGRHYSEYLDVDSLLLGYLIQEITENPDGAGSSFYFYKDSDLTGDGKLHYGPVWDFDLACCNYRVVTEDSQGRQYHSFDVNTLFVLYLHTNGYTPGSGLPEESFLGAMWNHPAMRLRTCLLYEERLKDVLAALTDGELDRMRDALAPSAEMNNARWNAYGEHPDKLLGPSTGESFAECTEYLRSFLVRRKAYLDEAYLMNGRISCGRVVQQRINEGYDWDETRALYIEALQESAKAETVAEANAVMEQKLAALAEMPKAERSGDFDLDGDVTLTDAIRLLQYHTDRMVGAPPEIDPTQRRNGDVDKNGLLDLADAIHVLMHYTEKMVGGDYPLPVVKG